LSSTGAERTADAGQAADPSTPDAAYRSSIFREPSRRSCLRQNLTFCTRRAVHRRDGKQKPNWRYDFLSER
jgi:hypothetical protein